MGDASQSLRKRAVQGATALAAGSLFVIGGRSSAGAAPGDQLNDTRDGSVGFITDTGQPVGGCIYHAESTLTEQDDGTYAARSRLSITGESCGGAMSIVVNYTDDDGDERRAVSQAAIGPPSVLLEIDGVGSSYIAQHDIRFSACDPELNDTCTLVVHTNPFSPK